jgi:hypothetical protein
MTTRFLPVILLAVLTAGCEIGERPPGVIVPGPTVPSPFPTVAPYVWDTADELSIWMNNSVARGSLALEGFGPDAFIRIDRTDQDWLMRGPDLEPAAEGVRTVSLRYRWRPDPGLAPGEVQTTQVSAHFETVRPTVSGDPTAQAHVSINLPPRGDWTDMAMIPQGQYKPPADVKYCYLKSYAANRGVLEIARIELVR